MELSEARRMGFFFLGIPVSSPTSSVNCFSQENEDIIKIRFQLCQT